jgi:hypothetical protein
MAAARSYGGLISGSQPPTISDKIEGVEGTWSYTPSSDSVGTLPGGGDGDLQVSNRPTDAKILGGVATVTVDKLEYNADPFVLNNIIITNNTLATQIHTVNVGLPTSFAAPNKISGTITTSIIDGALDGATAASVVGVPVYQAIIDNTSIVGTLQNHPFTLSPPSSVVSTSANASFGPVVNAVPVVSSISIQLRFTLTPNDTIAILSRFDVVAVPEPASWLLGGVALAFVARARRR